MINEDTEMLFPPRLIPDLGRLRGAEWQALTEKVQKESADAVPELAFVLMMVRLGGCTSCHVDSYWAMRGCTQCARNTIQRYKGTDSDLLGLFHAAEDDLEAHRKKSA